MNLQNRHFLSIKEVSNLIGISVSTINRGVEKGTFPPKHKLSAQRIGFLKYQIQIMQKSSSFLRLKKIKSSSILENTILELVF